MAEYNLTNKASRFWCFNLQTASWTRGGLSTYNVQESFLLFIKLISATQVEPKKTVWGHCLHKAENLQTMQDHSAKNNNKNEYNLNEIHRHLASGFLDH